MTYPQGYGINADSLLDCIDNLIRCSVSLLYQGKLSPCQQTLKKPFHYAGHALQKYDPNDPESKRDLAKIIAFGVKRAAKSLSTMEGNLQGRALNYFNMTGKLTKLLDRDEDLKKLAKEEGLDQASYKAVKGMAELDRLDTERTAAKKTLYTAAVGNRELDENVKRQALKSILKAELAEKTILKDARQTEDDPKVMEDYMKLKSKEVQPLSPKQFKNTDEYVKALERYQQAEREGKARGDAYSPDGKLWAGTPEMMWNSLKELYNPIPTMAKNLGTKEGQDQLDKLGSLLVSLIMIAFAVTLFAFPQEGIAVVVAVLSAALVIGDIRMFVYYFSMARHMVGGLTILYRAIILLDLGLFTATLNSIPLPYVMLYLASIHAFSGAVGIMRALEARRVGTGSWRLRLLHGIVDLLQALLCLIFIGSVQLAVYIYAAGLIYSAIFRIITAFQRMAIVYIQ